MYTVTFYSYKGGVGRTLALANVAWALAGEGDGCRVAIMDCDLEAPGIDVIPPFAPAKLPDKGGIVEYISEYVGSSSPDPDNLPSLLPYSYEPENVPNVRVIPAGKKDSRCQVLLTHLNWAELYKSRQGYLFFEQLKKKIRDEFAPDYLLVDSRTGLADISGITTHQLADMVVLVFNLNRQNLDGIRMSYNSIIATPRLPRIKVLLVASPVPKDQFLEPDLLNSRLKTAAETMPEAVNSRAAGENAIFQIPYHPVLALQDVVMLKEHPDYPVSEVYRQVAEKIQRNNPGETRYLLDKAFRYRDNNMFAEADEEFQSVIAQHPANPKGYYYYGDYLLKRGKPEEAVSQLGTACRLAGQNPRYLFSLGSALALLGRNEDALEKLEEAEKLDSPNEALLQKLASLHGELGNDEKYLEYFRKLHRVKLPTTRLEKMDVFRQFEYACGRFMQTGPGLEAGFDKSGFLSDLESSIIFDYQTKIKILSSIVSGGTAEKQITQLHRSLQQEQRRLAADFGYHLNTILNKLRHGDFAERDDEEGLRRLIRNEPSSLSAPFRILLVRLLNREGRYSAAAAVAAEAPEAEAQDNLVCVLCADWAYALSMLADLAQDDQKNELLNLACGKYEKAVTIKPDMHEALNNWASSLLRLSCLQEGGKKLETLRDALAKAQQAHRLHPGGGIYNIACAHALLGQTRKALAALKAAIHGDSKVKKMAAEDPDFESLRKSKTFYALIGETGQESRQRKAASRGAD